MNKRDHFSNLSSLSSFYLSINLDSFGLLDSTEDGDGSQESTEERGLDSVGDRMSTSTTVGAF